MTTAKPKRRLPGCSKILLARRKVLTDTEKLSKSFLLRLSQRELVVMSCLWAYIYQSPQDFSRFCRQIGNLSIYISYVAQIVFVNCLHNLKKILEERWYSCTCCKKHPSASEEPSRKRKPPEKPLTLTHGESLHLHMR